MYDSEDIYWEGGTDAARAADELADIIVDNEPAWLDEPDYAEDEA